MIVTGKLFLDLFIQIAPRLKTILGQDIMIIVTDREKILAYFPGDSIDIRAVAGAEIPAKDPILTAMDRKIHMTDIIPQEVYGIKYKSIMTPIFDNNYSVIGCIGIGVRVST